jgi:hypothetical protein
MRFQGAEPIRRCYQLLVERIGRSSLSIVGGYGLYLLKNKPVFTDRYSQRA